MPIRNHELIPMRKWHASMRVIRNACGQAPFPIIPQPAAVAASAQRGEGRPWMANKAAPPGALSGTNNRTWHRTERNRYATWMGPIVYISPVDSF